MPSVTLSNLQINENPIRIGGNPNVISMSVDIIINTNDINDQQFFYEVKNSENEIIAMQIHPQDHKIKPNTKVTIYIPQVFRTADGNYRLNVWSVSTWTGRRFNWGSHTGIKEYNPSSNVASISKKVSRIGTGFDRTRGQQTEPKEEVIVSGTKPFEKPERVSVFQPKTTTQNIINEIKSGSITVPSWFMNNVTWVQSGQITELEFVNAYNFLSQQEPIIPIGQEPEITFPSIPEVSAEMEIITIEQIDDKVTTNMIKQEIINFTIVNNRIQGSIKFTATNSFNPYYYNKEITNYLQLKSNDKIIHIKPNPLRFTEKERDELINFDEFAYDLDTIQGESYVWTPKDSAMSNKLEFTIEKGKETTKVTTGTSGLMGAGVVGAIGLIILLGVIGDKMGRNK